MNTKTLEPRRMFCPSSARGCLEMKSLSLGYSAASFHLEARELQLQLSCRCCQPSPPALHAAAGLCQCIVQAVFVVCSCVPIALGLTCRRVAVQKHNRSYYVGVKKSLQPLLVHITSENVYAILNKHSSILNDLKEVFSIQMCTFSIRFLVHGSSCDCILNCMVCIPN